MDENMDQRFSGLLFPIEHLQDLIDKKEKGIEIAMSELEEIECKKYLKMQRDALFDDEDDDDVLSASEEEHRQRLLREQLEAAKRKAHTNDVATIKLNEEQMKELEDDMSVSYVRPNPNTLYNKTDDQLYHSAEEKLLSEKLNRIRNCYFDADQWREIMNIIMEGIEFELKSDKFAYLGGYESRLAAFKSGKLKLQVAIPKLYLNRVSPERDPEVLRGIYNGDITVVERSAAGGCLHRKSYKDSELVSMPVSTISNAEHQYYVQWNRRGFQTPLSGAISAKSTIYNRYVDDKTKTYGKPFGVLDANGVPVQYDWLRLGPQEYFRLLHGQKPNMDNIIENVQAANGGKINKVLGERMNKLMHTDPRGISTEKEDPTWMSSSIQVKQETVKLEQQLLANIQATNP
jgi:hypothetical protein